MARPRDVRFYDDSDNYNPGKPAWLTEYCTNSRILVTYMEQRGAKSTAWHYTMRVLTKLYEYLIGSGLEYSDPIAQRWFDETMPHGKGERITLDRLHDIYDHGSVQPINAYPYALPYTDALCQPWNKLLLEYIEKKNVRSIHKTRSGARSQDLLALREIVVTTTDYNGNDMP